MKMETFKENTYYPVGKQLIYKDKIIEVCDTENKKEEMILCGKRCAMESQVKCLSHICKWYERNDKKSIFYAIVGDAPKHDKPGVVGEEYLSSRDNARELKTIAMNDNVHITVEPVAKKDVELRIQQALYKFMDAHKRLSQDMTILLSNATHEDLATGYRQLGLISSDSVISVYAGVKVRRSPDVKDIEIV